MQYTLHETILSYMKLSNNAKQTGYAQLREAAELAVYKIFKKTRESFVRKWVNVVNGKVEIPCSLENLLGVYVVDECGDTVALFEDNFKNTLPRPALKCKCNSCDADECMCPTIQDSIVTTDVIFPGEEEPRSNKTITRVLKNGDIVEYRIEWVPSYNAAGELQDILPIETQITKCKLDVKPCGCTINSDENASKLLTCGCIIDVCVPFLRKSYPSLKNDFGYYQYDHQLKTLHIFDSRGKKSKLKQVILSFQSNGADVMIPEYVRPALLALLDWTKKMYSPLYGPGDREESKRNYKREKNEMMRYLHPIPYEIFVQSGDYNAMNHNRRISEDPFHEEHKEPVLFCNPPVVANTGNTTIVNQYTTVISGDQHYDFFVPNDGWIGAVFTNLRCMNISGIHVDGNLRRLVVVAEDSVAIPPENVFYWKVASGILIFADPGLNADQWIRFDYKPQESCTPI